MQFERNRSNDYYDEQLYSIDEQICALLKKRHELSNKKPGCPPDEVVSKWAKKYGFYEEYLLSLFGMMPMADFFIPRVEPIGFRKYMPVLKAVEKDERFYSITYIRQYENASVVQLNIGWDEVDDKPLKMVNHNRFDLYVGEQYDCRMDRGSGTTGSLMNNYIVSPALPDDISGIKFIFTGYENFNNPTGLEIVI